MAPFSGSRSAPNTSNYNNNPRTPSSVSKQRRVSLINRLITPAPSQAQPAPSADHPVEVVARIRDQPEGLANISVLQSNQNVQTVRIRTDQGYRDFGLDGVSLAEAEDLQSFYKKYVENRIESVRMGGRCTIMMYGPTGSGKSHTMFGSAKEPGIAYRALQNILGGSNGGTLKVDGKYGDGSPDFSVKKLKVTVSILEIYNEEIYDLLAGSNAPNGHWTRPQSARVRLEIFGKRAKNAMHITGTDAGKIAKEIAKVEKRRVVKSTSCNERSSRSHCLVMLDVPSLGGKLVLVDMAGSENLEQAGLGLDTKMQTGKINQGNIALKRVVEAIANGDSYIPFRDSKLTMLLQDSFEDDESKILMVLCASPDTKDMHKTIATFEYGCKAKCIVSLPKSPAKEQVNGLHRHDPSIFDARVRLMEAQISKLELENRIKDKEKEEMIERLQQKEQDMAALENALKQVDQEHKDRCSKCCNEDARLKIENRIKECHRAAEEAMAIGERKLQEKVALQQSEIDRMRSRMKEIEREVELFLKTLPDCSHMLCDSRNKDEEIVSKVKGVLDSDSATYTEKSEKQLASSAQQLWKHDEYLRLESPVLQADMYSNACLPIIQEEESEGEEMMADDNDEEDMTGGDDSFPAGEGGEFQSSYDHGGEESGKEEAAPVHATSRRSRIENIFLLCGNQRELAAASTHKLPHETANHYGSNYADAIISIDHQSDAAAMVEGSGGGVSAISPSPTKKGKASPSNFYKETSARFFTDKTRYKVSENTPPPDAMSTLSNPQIVPSISQFSTSPSIHQIDRSIPLTSGACAKTNSAEPDADTCEVYVKWETSRESPGTLITILTTKRNTPLAEVRRELEKRGTGAAHDFTFLMLGDPSGTPVERKNESHLPVMSLPDCHNKQRGMMKLACLRPRPKQHHVADWQIPLCPLENQKVWNVPNQPNKPVTPSPHKSSSSPLGLITVGSTPRSRTPVSCHGEPTSETKQRPKLPLISHVKGLRF